MGWKRGRKISTRLRPFVCEIDKMGREEQESRGAGKETDDQETEKERENQKVPK